MKNSIEIPKGTQLIDLADIKEGDWVFFSYKATDYYGSSSWIAIVGPRNEESDLESRFLYACIMITSNSSSDVIGKIKFFSDQDTSLDMVRSLSEEENELMIQQLNERGVFWSNEDLRFIFKED